MFKYYIIYFSEIKKSSNITPFNEYIIFEGEITENWNRRILKSFFQFFYWGFGQNNMKLGGGYVKHKQTFKYFQMFNFSQLLFFYYWSLTNQYTGLYVYNVGQHFSSIYTFLVYYDIHNHYQYFIIS